MAAEILPFEARVKTVREFLGKHRESIASALPKHVSADRLLRVALTSCERTPRLLEADPKSLLGAVLTCAQLGIEPDSVVGQAYLIPFRNNKMDRTDVQVIIGYKGLLDLARRSGNVSGLDVHVVRKTDKFRVQWGGPRPIRHTPDLGAALADGSPPPDVIAAYAIVNLRDGGQQCDVMSVTEIEKVRRMSKAANEGPWVTHWIEMAKKTVLRRCLKLAPCSVETQKAVALDELAEAEINQDLAVEADARVIEPPVAPPKPPSILKAQVPPEKPEGTAETPVPKEPAVPPDTAKPVRPPKIPAPAPAAGSDAAEF